MKNDWSTFTHLNGNDVTDGWLKVGKEVFCDYCKTKDLKELTQKVLNAAGRRTPLRAFDLTSLYDMPMDLRKSTRFLTPKPLST